MRRERHVALTYGLTSSDLASVCTCTYLTEKIGIASDSGERQKKHVCTVDFTYQQHGTLSVYT